MVKRFHRQLKAAIMAHESPNPWTVKELLGRSAAEIVYVTTLSMPGKFSHKFNVDAHRDLDKYSDQLRVAMSRLRLCPLPTQLRTTFSNIKKSTHAHMYFCDESQLHRL